MENFLRGRLQSRRADFPGLPVTGRPAFRLLRLLRQGNLDPVVALEFANGARQGHSQELAVTVGVELPDLLRGRLVLQERAPFQVEIATSRGSHFLQGYGCDARKGFLPSPEIRQVLMPGNLNRQPPEPLLGLQKLDRGQPPGSLEIRFGQDALLDPLDGGQGGHRRPVQPQAAGAEAENEIAALSRNPGVGAAPMSLRPGHLEAAIQHRGPARGQNGLQNLAGDPVPG